MLFLVDEMFGPVTAGRLRELGHDAVHVEDRDLTGAADPAVFACAVREDRVIVTENVKDFVPLLDRADQVVPVLVALKRNLPPEAGAMAHELAARVDRWARDHPDPYRHAHWLG